jgi:hypothetical protein
MDSASLYELVTGIAPALNALRHDLADNAFTYLPSCPLAPEDDTGERNLRLGLPSGSEVLLSGTSPHLFVPPADSSSPLILVHLEASKRRISQLLYPYLFLLARNLGVDKGRPAGEAQIAVFYSTSAPADKRGTQILGTKYSGVVQKPVFLTERANGVSAATVFLQALLTDMLEKTDYHHLPIEAIESLYAQVKRTGDDITVSMVERWLEDDAHAVNPIYQPRLSSLLLTEPRVPADCADICRRRLYPFFAGRFDG